MSHHVHEKRIAILIRPFFRGEISFAYRIKSACKNLDWKADIIDITNPEELRKNKYDFVINLVPGKYEQPNCKNYLAIFHPTQHYFNKKGALFKRYRNYEGYLLTYSPGDKDKVFATPHQFPHIKKWYPTVQSREYKKVNPSHLFYICCSWGNRLKDEKFQKCLSLLDKEPYMRLYGNQEFQTLYPQSYKGSIVYDSEQLYETAAEAGVTLV
ncbi:MAG: hypothetical protein ACM3JI_03585, partial [Anaerolineae bacterium]